jgi:hypothetical protein
MERLLVEHMASNRVFVAVCFVGVAVGIGGYFVMQVL